MGLGPDHREIVFSNLKSALENGYDVRTWPVDDIVNDLMCFADDCAVCEPDDLRQHVQAWLRENAPRPVL